MKFFRPSSLLEALSIKAEYPDAVPIAGGTDLMVSINFDRIRPPGLLDLSGISELQTVIDEADGVLRIGAGVTFNRLHRDYANTLRGLAMAAATVGSPQIRNRATIGGNLATASPAGDSLPPLVAAGAEVELASVDGTRKLSMEKFLLGPKRSALQPNELIVAIHVPSQSGPQLFSKVGTRNAMVISIASIALELRPIDEMVCCAIGSSAPTVIRVAAVDELSALLPWPKKGEAPVALSQTLLDEFGNLVGKACSPIDDMRGSARYRRRSLEVLARRNLNWAWQELGRRTSCA